MKTSGVLPVLISTSFLWSGWASAQDANLYLYARYMKSLDNLGVGLIGRLGQDTLGLIGVYVDGDRIGSFQLDAVELYKVAASSTRFQLDVSPWVNPFKDVSEEINILRDENLSFYVYCTQIDAAGTFRCNSLNREDFYQVAR